MFDNRIDIKHGNKRCTDMEVNYLLPTLQHYLGLKIPTTNLSPDIDDRLQLLVREVTF